MTHIRMAAMIVIMLFVIACGTPDQTPSSPLNNGAAFATVAETQGSAVNPDASICTITAVSLAAIPDVHDLTWASEHIIVGTIVEAFPSTPDPEAPQQPLYTEFAVKVEQSFRGDAIEQLRIRQPGGVIPDGCTDLSGAVPLAVGDRFLLFLSHPQPETSHPTYLVVGERQGYWRVAADGTLTGLETQFQKFDSKPISTVAAEIAAVLAEPAPDRPIVGFIPVVSLNTAPPSNDLPTGFDQ